MKFKKITVSYGKKISANYNTDSLFISYDVELSDKEGSSKEAVEKITEVLHSNLEEKVTELLNK